MKTFIPFLVVFIFLAFMMTPTTSQGQEPSLTHYTAENGLPGGDIYHAYEDQNGYIWFGTERGIYRFDGYNFKWFNLKKFNVPNEAWGINKDMHDNIWFAVFNNLLWHGKEGFQAHSLASLGPEASLMIKEHFFDSLGNHFFSTDGLKAKGIYEILSSPSDSIVFHPYKENFKYSESYAYLSYLFQDSIGQKWFSSANRYGVQIVTAKDDSLQMVHEYKINTDNAMLFHGLKQMSRESFLFTSSDELIMYRNGSFSTFSCSDVFGKELKIESYIFSNHFICLYTSDGFKVLNHDFELLPEFNFLKDNKDISSLFKDTKGNIWICSRNGEIYFLSAKARNSLSFSQFSRSSRNEISALVVLPDNQLLIGTHSGELWLKNDSLSFSKIEVNFNFLTGKDRWRRTEQKILFLTYAHGVIWVAYQSGLVLSLPLEQLSPNARFDISNGLKVNSKPLPIARSQLPIVLKAASIKGGNLGDDKNVQISTADELFSLNYSSNDDAIYVNFHQRGRSYTSIMCNDKLWIGKKRGLFFIDTTSDYDQKEYRDTNFTGSINLFKTTKSGHLWLVMDDNRLFRYKGNQIDTIKSLSSDDLINAIYVDADDHLWVATNHGITYIQTRSDEPFDYKISHLSETHGLLNNEVNDLSVTNRKVYAATSKGLCILDRKTIESASVNTEIIFTDFLVNDQVQTGLKDHYNLSYDQDNITIKYVCLSYKSLKKIQYQYKMSGIDDDWQTTTDIGREYATLSPGNYTFSIRATDAEGFKTATRQLSFTIRPPWWQTNTAFLCYGLLFFSLSYGVYSFELRRNSLKNEAKRLKEVDELKNRLFTNITHEFRTPLTLILGSVEQINEQTVSSPISNEVRAIDYQGKKLLGLINQILELSKLEVGELPLHQIQDDIIPFIKSIVEQFRSFAENANVNLVHYAKEKSLVMDFDPEKIQMILVNLISNALKHSSAGDEIIILSTVEQSEKNDTLSIQVMDTGAGIKEEYLPFIFDRFYFAKEHLPHLQKSAGLGLAICKELVELMGGTITASSNYEKGSVFTLFLPIKKTAPNAHSDIKQEPINLLISPKMVSEHENITTSIDKAENRLLIVEDNDDIVRLLKQFLSPYYTIIIAENGREGVKTAINEIPDLIISDVMMPEMDGIEFCKNIKQNEKTSHIPIILLTGKVTYENRLEGINAGAEAYLTKPFKKKELLAHIEQLVKNRERLQNRYATPTLSEINEPFVKKEDIFITKIRTIIDENIDNEQLDVNFLCSALSMSRSQLHRKVKFLTGSSVAKIIRSMRLTKAKELLIDSELTIAEISYACGFDPHYFTSAFKSAFGESPSQFRKGNA